MKISHQHTSTYFHLFMICLFTLYQTGCKKDNLDTYSESNDIHTSQFFKMTGTVSSEMRKVHSDLLALNDVTPFTRNIINAAGIPRWDKGYKIGSNRISTSSFIATNNSTNNAAFFIIPVVDTGNSHITGAIIVRQDSTPSYHLLRLADYGVHTTDRANFIQAMMILDARVYGYNRFKINDSSALGNAKEVYFTESVVANLTGTPGEEYNGPCREINWWYVPEPPGTPHIVWTYYEGSDCLFTPQQTTSVLLPGGGVWTINTPLPPYYYPIVGPVGGPGGNPNPPPPYTPVPTTLQQKTDYLIQELNLDFGQQSNLTITDGSVSTLFEYVFTQNTLKRRQIAIWAIEYFSTHFNLNMEVFKKQFLGNSEGFDDELDEQYWDNPTNIFPPQSLPSWADFETAYPKTKGGNMDAGDVYDLVGGSVKALRDGVKNDNNPSNDDRYENACALRLSRALNYAGIVLPSIPGQTFIGGDNKYYFLGAANLNRWMRKTFGCANPDASKGEFTNPNASNFNTTQIGTNGENLPALLAGKKGIYTIVTNSSWASGHCDMLYDDATCIGDCHFADPQIIYYCDVWNLM